jgi:hypothetical protein
LTYLMAEICSLIKISSASQRFPPFRSYSTSR